MHQKIPVITAEMPFRRYAPHPDPLLLEDGAFADVQNVVIDQGLPRVRDGVGAFSLNSATTIEDGEFCGGGIFEFGSGRLALRAIWDGTHVRIEGNVSNDGTTWGGWFEATSASGKGGDTRMQRPERGLVQFQMVPPSSNETSARIVIQTGKDLPRLMTIADPSALRIIHPVEPPSGIESHPAIASVVSGLDIASGSHNPATSSGGDSYSVTIMGTTGHQVVLLEPENTTADAGEWVELTYGAVESADLSASKQAFLLFACGSEEDPQPWLRHKIFLCNGSSGDLQLIYDPNNAEYAAIQASCEATYSKEITLAAFNLGGLNLNLDDVRGFRLEVVEPNATSFEVLGILGGGRVNGAASYKVSHYSTWMQSESPGVTLRYGAAAREGDFDGLEQLEIALTDNSISTRGQHQLPGVTQGEYGWPSINLRLPVEPTLYYQFLVPVLSPTDQEGGRGVDEARVYRRDPGEGLYSLVQYASSAAYTGGAWQPYGGGAEAFTEWNQRRYVVDNVARESKQFQVPAPSAQNTSVPQGYAMAMASSRLYVGAVRNGDANEGQSVVYASEIDLGLRFRNVNASANQSIADRDAFVIGLAQEDALALRATATSAIGIEGLYCWTTQGLYRLADLRAERIGSEGLSAPNSAAEKNGLVLWLDNQNELQAFAGQSSNLSRNQVESVLNQIPASRRRLAVGSVWRDVYYLAHAGEGDTENRSAFVYSLTRGRFEGRFRLPSGMGVAQFQVWEYGGETKMLAWDRSGRLWEWLKPGQMGDAADEANIELRLTTKRFRPSPQGRMAFRRTLIVADDQAATWTVSHDVQGPDSTVTGTLAVPGTSGSPVQIYDSAEGSSTLPVGGAGYSLQTTLSAELPAGTRLCEWVFEGREVHIAAGSAG